MNKDLTGKIFRFIFSGFMVLLLGGPFFFLFAFSVAWMGIPISKLGVILSLLSLGGIGYVLFRRILWEINSKRNFSTFSWVTFSWLGVLLADLVLLSLFQWRQGTWYLLFLGVFILALLLLKYKKIVLGNRRLIITSICTKSSISINEIVHVERTCFHLRTSSFMNILVFSFKKRGPINFLLFDRGEKLVKMLEKHRIPVRSIPHKKRYRRLKVLLGFH